MVAASAAGARSSVRRACLFFLFFVLLSFGALALGGCARGAPDAAAGTVTVVRVIDGDTIEVLDPQRGRVRVRYIGVDTPEISGPAECFGPEAHARNRALVEGKQVRLERDTSDTDRYGRWLRYVFVGETFVNGALVQGGYAAAVCYPPDLKRQETLEALEREARAEQRGLWGPACAAAPHRRPRFRER
ncbi:MAG: thermonuclease family protein [Chloroflexi bacterium]|nr:thermonuclease family protein [Chloroflexota bacterium]